MRLIDLSPEFVGAGGPGVTNQDGSAVPARSGVGVMFDCPCGCDLKCFVAFANPMDGGPRLRDERIAWQRTGETFEALTLTPSILRSKEKGGCGWHGFITNGEIVSC